jgi:hypothetical protein
MTTTSATKWWWNKKPKPTKSVASSINGADEDASIFSLYSYNNNDYYCPTTTKTVSSSLHAQHTKSEYSVDIESNASILSKPWISKNMTETEAEADQQQQQQQQQQHTMSDEDDEEEDDDAYSAPPLDSTDFLDDSPIIQSSNSSCIIKESPSKPPKRRASLVDYIVNKPLHGKIKVKIIHAKK